MSRSIVVVGVCALSLVISGCDSSAESLIKEEISLMNEIADAYEKNAPANTIQEINDRMEAHYDKLRKKTVTEEELQKIRDKYKGQLIKASERISVARAKWGKGS